MRSIAMVLTYRPSENASVAGSNFRHPLAFTPRATNMLNAERGVRSESAPEVALMWQTAAMGIGILAHGSYRQGLKTLTMKVPDELLGLLEHEARRAGQPKSALVREILQQHQRRRHQSALDLAVDLCGCVRSGLGDFSRNRKHLKGFGR